MALEHNFGPCKAGSTSTTRMADRREIDPRSVAERPSRLLHWWRNLGCRHDSLPADRTHFDDIACVPLDCFWHDRPCQPNLPDPLDVEELVQSSAGPRAKVAAAATVAARLSRECDWPEIGRIDFEQPLYGRRISTQRFFRRTPLAPSADFLQRPLLPKIVADGRGLQDCGSPPVDR